MARQGCRNAACLGVFSRTLAASKHGKDGKGAEAGNQASETARSEIPGRFSALRARASAMYAPELKGNSDEIKLQIAD